MSRAYYYLVVLLGRIQGERLADQIPPQPWVLLTEDTLWASGYELYDRISEPYQRFLETLTATFEQPGFRKVAEQAGFRLYDRPRGAPENVGSELRAVHPVVRTNPVTGWKSIFPVGGHVKHVNGLTEEESAQLLGWFLDLVYKNHDLQVRFKWRSKNDIGEFLTFGGEGRCCWVPMESG